MSDEQRTGGGTGCGCLPLIATILVLWSLWFGLPTPWGTYNIDIFPPAIRRTDQPPAKPEPVKPEPVNPAKPVTSNV